MACNPTMCIPKWDDFIFSFEVLEGDKRPEYKTPLVLDYNYSDNESNTNVSNQLEEQINKGLFSFLIFFRLSISDRNLDNLAFS